MNLFGLTGRRSPSGSPQLTPISGENRYKVNYLNSVFLFAGVVAFGMGFIRYQSSALMGLLDFGFSITAFALLGYLWRHPEKVETLSSIAIACCFILFFAIYLLAPYNTTRISLFHLLLASAFFLKGRKAGLVSLVIIVGSLLVGYFIPVLQTGYSLIDVLTACLYLVAMLFIFNNYETYREEQDLALRESHTRLNILIETLSDAIFLKDGAGRWQIANQTGLGLFRLRDKPWQGKTDGELGEMLPELAAAFDACVATDESAFAQQGVSLSEEQVLQDGEIRDFEVRKFPRFAADGSRAGLVIIGRDVSERKHKDRLIEVSEQRFRSVFNQAAVGIALVAPDGRFIKVNDKLCAIAGYTQEELLALSFQKITHHEDLSADEEYVRQLLGGQIRSYAMEKRYLRKDGSVVWANLNVSLVRDDSGQPMHFVSVVEDISLLKQLDREIAEMGEQQLRHIGMELHDNLGQQLTGIALLMKSLETSLVRKQAPEAVETARLVEYLNQAISTVRSMAHGLYAQDAEHRGLATSLRRLATQASELTGVNCQVRAEGDLPELKPDVVLHLYRIAQEAISNAIRHGKPTEVSVHLIVDDSGGLWLRVSNDLKVDALKMPDEIEKGVGLQLMRHRANLIGAMLVIDAHPGVSMSIVVHVPLGPNVLAANPLHV